MINTFYLFYEPQLTVQLFHSMTQNLNYIIITFYMQTTDISTLSLLKCVGGFTAASISNQFSYIMNVADIKGYVFKSVNNQLNICTFAPLWGFTMTPVHTVIIIR